MLTLFIVISISYLVVIGVILLGFDKVEEFNLQDVPARTKFSLIIPFRNEAENLTNLLKSIEQLNYPPSYFEVVLINDKSEDKSVEIIEKIISKKSFSSLNLQIIDNQRRSNAAKKDAITLGVSLSKNEWIVTTDADCILPKYWLDSFDEFIQHHETQAIVAPVTYKGVSSFFNRFQTLDFLSLQGVTIGSFGIQKPMLCNGANFAYLKTAFYHVSGFDGNTTIASGDDVFLLEKLVKKNKKNVHYLKCKQAIVTTHAAKNLDALLHQRIRWASKTSSLAQKTTKIIGALVILENVMCLSLLPTYFLGLISIKSVLALLIIKFSIDFLLVFKTLRFFKQEAILPSFIISSLLYPVFNIGIFILSFFKSYRWKGRTSKK
ncbi:glycosyltransferase [Winogradskyella eckloniae]|uniref:glycosyltransferase family 2 protein n=1 Tax=Winogradskyella eckloniae TaxID=1089306 RepID=UPI0015649C09|nr:glycosyltransferase [Winogradskyella eckloniae]NRD19188.1 glycosyltransferase [Winogradskyella eckloniae]